MNRKLSALLDAYDLDTWIWLPVENEDPTLPGKTEEMLAQRDKLFQSMPRLDHVFVPGGDPGDLPPAALMPFLEKLAAVLRRTHPNAGLWVSPQGFKAENLAAFYRILQQQQPAWLTGVVYGPWVRDTLEHCRQAVPARYRLRRYPDISHCVRCQYPVPEWDRAFALTLGREPINPRPVAQAHIHNRFMHLAEGALTYSEGVSDDVNKFVWSERLWDPQRPVRDILVEYGRAFVGAQHAEAVADGLFALETDWRGPLLHSSLPRHTLTLWETLWNDVGETGRKNWRVQQGYFRALYDVYVQGRLERETEQENAALDALRSARSLGAQEAAQRARTRLQEMALPPELETLKQQLRALGEQLWRSIGMQMSVPLYHADNPERGAVLDYLDTPLNNRVWLLAQMETALALPEENARVAALEKAARWTDAGPGGYYDDLGNAGQERHLVRNDWEQDPGFVRSAQDEFGAFSPGSRLSWGSQASALYETPLTLRFPDLDTKARYRLRVVYNGRFRPLMRLEANDGLLIHGPLRGPAPPSVMEFPLPPQATESGMLTLRWHCLEGRGAQVAEVWLVREP
jgi:hypothetical protein